VDHDELLRRVRQRAGLDQRGAELAVVATFAAIGRTLDSLDPPQPLALVDVAAMLPPRFATLLREGAKAGGPAQFLAAVAEREQLTLGQAKEHAQVVCETFAGMLDPRRLTALRERLPAEIAALWQPYEPPPELPQTARHPRHGSTLATGRPGSNHPLSEAAPRAGQPHSLPVTDDPHADTRLASTKGPSPERDRETLANGKPGSTRPVSDGHGPDS
jgi:uncharacterized protein (DUF2267 family)